VIYKNKTSNLTAFMNSASVSLQTYRSRRKAYH